MTAQFDRLHADERGVTLTELLIVSLMVTLMMGIILTLFSGFFRDTGFVDDLAQAERDTRPVIRDLLIHTRQSIARDTAPDDFPVAEVDWDRLVFYSDRLPYDDDGAPERHEYLLVNCSNGVAGGVCDLQLTVWKPDTSVGPPWTYTGPAEFSRIELENVLADDPGVVPNNELFSGWRWSGGALTQVPTCLEGSATPCEFPIVSIDLRVDPSLILENPRVFEIHEKVRLRNADA